MVGLGGGEAGWRAEENNAAPLPFVPQFACKPREHSSSAKDVRQDVPQYAVPQDVVGMYSKRAGCPWRFHAEAHVHPPADSAHNGLRAPRQSREPQPTVRSRHERC